MGDPVRSRLGTGGTVSTIKNSLRRNSRRDKRRFPIEQDCRYCVKGRRLSAVGVGKTIEISSDEVRFTTQHPLERGEKVRLAVAWPAMLDNACLLKLEICGRVVRSEPGTAAIEIAHHDFRTRGNSFTAISENMVLWTRGDATATTTNQ